MCTVSLSIIARPLGIERIIGRRSSDWGTGIDPCDATSQYSSPSVRQIAASPASHSCAAVFSDDIEHGLNIRRRASDHAENFTRRRLLLQRLLEFVEQSHVLDGDHRLMSEGFKQFNLFIGERPNFESPDKDSTDGNALAEQGCR